MNLDLQETPRIKINSGPITDLLVRTKTIKLLGEKSYWPLLVWQIYLKKRGTKYKGKNYLDSIKIKHFACFGLVGMAPWVSINL